MATLAERIDALQTSVDVMDPGLAESTVINNPAPAMPTDGPDRLTFHVPGHCTVLSLGQESGSWDTSVGIVGKTNPNVYFETTEAPKTAVSLGTSGKGSGYIGTGITGYMVKTDGNIFRHADKQLYFTTTGGDMVLNADSGSAVLQSDCGTVEVNAGGTVSVKATGDVALTAQSFAPYDATYATSFSHQDIPETQDGEKGMAWAEIVQSVIDFALLIKSLHFEADEMEPGRHDVPINKAAIVVAGVKILTATWSALQSHKVLGGFLESVKLNATNDVGLGAGLSGLIGGTLTGSATGKAYAAMIGSVSAVVGLAYAAVWGGIMTGMRARKVFLSSHNGTVGVQGTKAVSLRAGQSVRLASGKNIQLNTETCGVAVYGGQVYVGAGSTYGLVADGDQIHIGKVGSAEAFDAPAPQKEQRIQIKRFELFAHMSEDSQLNLGIWEGELKYKDSFIKFGTKGIDAYGKGVVEFKPS